MGDPGRRGAPGRRTARAGRDVDDRRAERRRPHRGQLQPGRARVLRVLDAALHARLALAGGRPGARRAGRRGAHPRRRHGGRPHAASGAPPRRPSTSSSRRGSDRERRPTPAPSARASPTSRGYARAADGLRLYWEIHGGGSTTIVLLPPTPDQPLAASGRRRSTTSRATSASSPTTGAATATPSHPDPAGAPGWTRWCASDCLAVMDATAHRDAPSLAGICSDGVWPSVQIAAAHPERVARHHRARHGRSAADPAASVAARGARDLRRGARAIRRAGRRRTAPTCARDYAGFLEFFFGEMFPEPHSTKQVEDAVAFGLDGVGRGDADGRRRRRRLDARRRSRRRAGACAARCSSCTATSTTASRSTAASRSPS